LLPQARALAADMAQMPLEILVTYKKLIDDGFALPFGEAIALEQSVSASYNAGVSAAEIQARREAVQARGRSQ
jgi:enoyl-CoA hydratase